MWLASQTGKYRVIVIVEYDGFRHLDSSGHYKCFPDVRFIVGTLKEWPGPSIDLCDRTMLEHVDGMDGQSYMIMETSHLLRRLGTKSPVKQVSRSRPGRISATWMIQLRMSR
jgi:hypothetical protein